MIDLLHGRLAAWETLCIGDLVHGRLVSWETCCMEDLLHGTLAAWETCCIGNLVLGLFPAVTSAVCNRRLATLEAYCVRLILREASAPPTPLSFST